MKRKAYLAALCFMVTLFSLVGCEGADQGDKALEEARDAGLAVGETAEVGSLSFTLNGVRCEPGDESWAPEAGERWLVFDCTVENRGAESTFVTAIMPASTFKLYDTEGYSKDTTVIATAKGDLNAEIAPFRKVSGEVAFVVNENEDEWEFIFSPHDNTGEAIYRIEKSDIK